MPAKVKSQNLSILLTDIQGYSTTSSTASRDEIIQIVRRHTQLMVPVIDFHGGRIVKTVGDAFLCTFSSATDAVICAVVIQLVLREYNQRQAQQILNLNLRCVISSGDVTLESGDIFGDAVNVTARMASLPCFPGGSVGISEATYLIMDRGEIVSEKIGPQTLKGIAEPVTVYQVPVEKQKFGKIPTPLIKLVEKVLAMKEGDESPLHDWTAAGSGMMLQKDWGKDFSQMSQDLGQNLNEAKKQLFQTFAQKTVIEISAHEQLKDARIQSRLKTFFIDFAIIMLGSFFLRILWLPISNLLAGTVLGLIAWFIDINLTFPYVLTCAYFAIFWKLKNATPGQIAGQTAVVTLDGSPLTWKTAILRSLLFALSITLLGLGVVMIFFGEKKTFYDKICQTRVVE